MSYAKMAERFRDFEIRRFKDEKKIRKTKILRIVHRPGSMSGPAGPKKQELRNQFARGQSETTRQK